MPPPTRPLLPFYHFLTRFMYTHFDFNTNEKHLAVIHSVASNISVTVDEPAMREDSDYTRDEVHNLAIRTTITKFVREQAQLDAVTEHCAIEFMTEWMVKNETLGRIFATASINSKNFKLNREQQDALGVYLGDLGQRPPTFLAELMVAQAWAIQRSAGWDALLTHYRTHLHQPLQELFSIFKGLLSRLPEFRATVIEDANQCWIRHHHNVEHHHNELLRNELPSVASSIREELCPLNDLLAKNLRRYAKGGTLEYSQLRLAFLGSDYMSYVLREHIDYRWLLHYASVKGVNKFGTCLQSMILSDEILALLVNMTEAGSLVPQGAAPQVVAQCFAAAVAQLYDESDPVEAQMTVDMVLGYLCAHARDVASTFGIYPKVLSPESFAYDGTQEQESLSSGHDDGTSQAPAPQNPPHVTADSTFSQLVNMDPTPVFPPLWFLSPSAPKIILPAVSSSTPYALPLGNTSVIQDE